MQYKSITISSKNTFKRFSHSKRFLLTAELLRKHKCQKILDYGAGDGEVYKFLDDKTKKWTDSKGNKCFTYYDLDNMGYRTAVGDYVLTPKGYN